MDDGAVKHHQWGQTSFRWAPFKDRRLMDLPTSFGASKERINAKVVIILGNLGNPWGSGRCRCPAGGGAGIWFFSKKLANWLPSSICLHISTISTILLGEPSRLSTISSQAFHLTFTSSACEHLLVFIRHAIPKTLMNKAKNKFLGFS